VSEPAPEPLPNGAPRRESRFAAPELRVENRSDRVWVFGYLRMAPALAFFGGILLSFVVWKVAGPLPLAVGVPLVVLPLVLPIFLDRSTLLDPVDYLLLGERIHVKRLAGARDFHIENVASVAFAQPAGEEYDEKQRAQRFADMRFRFRGAWLSVRLLVTEADARKVAEWAAAHGISIVERPA
jgi:hypothetical protein